jgi:hypothetical protein
MMMALLYPLEARSPVIPFQIDLLGHASNRCMYYCRFNVYDAAEFAPAHFLLPKRLASNLGSGGMIAAPGQAGRWKLPEDPSAWTSLGQVMNNVMAASEYKVK